MSPVQATDGERSPDRGETGPKVRHWGLELLFLEPEAEEGEGSSEGCPGRLSGASAS